MFDKTVGEQLADIRGTFLKMLLADDVNLTREEKKAFQDMLEKAFAHIELQIGYDILRLPVKKLGFDQGIRLRACLFDMTENMNVFLAFITEKAERAKRDKNDERLISVKNVFQAKMVTAFLDPIAKIMEELPSAYNAIAPSSVDDSLPPAYEEPSPPLQQQSQPRRQQQQQQLQRNQPIRYIAQPPIQQTVFIKQERRAVDTGFLEGVFLGSILGGRHGSLDPEIACLCCWAVLFCAACSAVDASDLPSPAKFSLQLMLGAVGVGVPVAAIVAAASVKAASSTTTPVAAHAAKASVKASTEASAAATTMATAVVVLKILSAVVDAVILLPYVLKNVVKDVRNLWNNRKIETSRRRLILTGLAMTVGFLLGFLIPFGGPLTGIGMMIFVAWTTQRIEKYAHQKSAKNIHLGDIAPNIQVKLDPEIARRVQAQALHCSHPEKYHFSDRQIAALASSGVHGSAERLRKMLETIARAEKLASKKDQNIAWKAADFCWDFYNKNSKRECAVAAIKHLKAYATNSGNGGQKEQLGIALKQLGLLTLSQTVEDLIKKPPIAGAAAGVEMDVKYEPSASIRPPAL